MADNAFDHAFDELLANEGDFVDNPADPGGATRYGITERVARRHGYGGEMKDLPLPLAKSIARTEYWDPVHGDELPGALAFQVFDACYHSGAPAAIRWLQGALGILHADGIFGPATAAKLEQCLPALDKLILVFLAYRLTFMTSLSTWPVFGKGWANRIAKNLLHAAE